jgi:HK97 family phage major capsid protein
MSLRRLPRITLPGLPASLSNASPKQVSEGMVQGGLPAFPRGRVLTSPSQIAGVMAAAERGDRNPAAAGEREPRSPMELLGDVADAFAAFRDRTDQRLDAMTSQLDDSARTTAALGMGAGAPSPIRQSGATSVRIPEAARASMVQFMQAGVVDAPHASMRTDSNPDGGYTVPREIDGVIDSLLLLQVPMRQVANIVTVTSGEYHKLMNLRGAVSGWVGETEDRPETGTPQLADIEPPIGEVYANPSLTQRILDDSTFDLASFIGDNIVDEFAQQENIAFTAGNGIKKPIGFLAYPTASTADGTRSFGTLQFLGSGNSAGFATTNPGDNLYDLLSSLKASYRSGPGVGWQMNSTTLGIVRKFKDGQGNYLWQQSLQAGQPDLLLGYPVYPNESMQDLGANAFPVAFGNWKRGYTIVDRIGVKLLRDPYTKKGWVNFYTTKRVGGAVVDSQAIKLLKCA